MGEMNQQLVEDLETILGSELEELRAKRAAEEAEAKAARVAELKAQLPALLDEHAQAVEQIRVARQARDVAEVAFNKEHRRLEGAKQARRHANNKIAAIRQELAELGESTDEVV